MRFIKNWWFVGLCFLIFAGLAYADRTNQAHLERPETVVRYWWVGVETPPVLDDCFQKGQFQITAPTPCVAFADPTARNLQYAVGPRAVLQQFGCVFNDITGITGGERIDLVLKKYSSGVDIDDVVGADVILGSTTTIGRVCASTTNPSTAADCDTELGIDLSTGLGGNGISTLALHVDVTSGGGNEVLNSACWADIRYSTPNR